MSSNESWTVMSSWTKICNCDPRTPIDVLSSHLFQQSSYRIGMLNINYRDGATFQEPFVLIEKSKKRIYGDAGDVRQDPNLIHVRHLNSSKLVEYIEKYKNKKYENEPINHFKSIKHDHYSEYNTSMISIFPLITEKKWIERDKLQILTLFEHVASHVINEQKRKINRLSSESAESTIERLQRQNIYDMDQILGAFADQTIFNFLNYNNIHQIKGKGRGAGWCCTIPPEKFKSNLKGLFILNGGRQTVFVSNEECYIIENMSNDLASLILLSNTRKLRVRDQYAWVFEAINVTLHYSCKTLRLSVSYKIGIRKKGRIHRRS